ncbi:hypothetical protein EX30DRAFT_377686 [Ascodesmis nigricans]|uniref:Nephrocystin 3-like N-terminal domain-containing protein n=1 Tax=Ascodesmis nigricans TaxID=341454 RepID=A0A4S2MWE5_9PEZI|nr:hypothetical protein EX30DRAFT_377686 [Ascodesmis nigricans]
MYPPSTDHGIAYLYCNYKENGQAALNLMSSLLKQLIHRRPNLPQSLEEVYSEHRSKQTRPNLSEYLTLFQNEIRQLRRTFIVIGALDECSEADYTRQKLS